MSRVQVCLEDGVVGPMDHAFRVGLHSAPKVGDVHVAVVDRLEGRGVWPVEALGRNFSVETTLSSIMYVRRIKKWKFLGYRITLHFIETPSADFSVKRVASRVASGGHDIPETDIRRRFRRGLRLFHETYKPLVDGWYHWYTTDGGTRLVERHET